MRTLAEYRALIEAALPDRLPPGAGYGAVVVEAARYSLLSGGKRLRGALLLAACECAKGSCEDAMYAACAIECVHAYSLIHDDLPALDNDDIRRGKPSCHAAFGEATAILAGDGLNTHAFYLLAEGARRTEGSADRHIRALWHIASAAGFSGMVSGQMADMTCLDPADKNALEYIQVNKTAKLFSAAAAAGAEIGGATEAVVDAFSRYGLHLGLAFQAADDVLDAVGDASLLGKTTGKDAEQGKLTMVSAYGIETAKERVKVETAAAVDALKTIENTEFFENLAHSLVNRAR